MADLTTTTTPFPAEPDLKLSTGAKALSDEIWNAVSIDGYQTVRASIDARSALEENLRTWLAIVESDLDSEDVANDRWEDCSNLLIPVGPTQLQAMVSYLALQVFTNRFIIVSGNTKEAAETAAQVERYFNAELMRQREETTWYNDLLTTLYLGLRDGTCVLESMWEKTVSTKLTPVFDQVFEDDPDNPGQQVPKFDENGEPVSERRMVEQEVTEYDDVRVVPISLKNFGVIPATAPSIEKAVAVWKVVWLMEDELDAMAEASKEPNSGLHFDREEVERALQYSPVGTDEVSSDSQGSYEKTAGHQIETGLAQGTMVSPTFKNRGPIKCFQLHTKQHDFNGDGKPEENVLWIHELSQRMIGWCASEYLAPERPFHAWCPFPRPEAFNGYSLIEWLAPLIAEISAIHNQRRDAIDLHISPPFIEKPSAEVMNKGKRWGPNETWLSDDKDAITVLTLPQMPPDAMQEEMNLLMYVGQVTGNDSPALGVQSSGRRSATETKQRESAQQNRSGLVAMRFRHFARRWINFVWRLKLQYLSDNVSFTGSDDQKYTLSRQTLAKDYGINIAGASDPVDATTRRTEMTMFASTIVKLYPQIAQKPTQMHRLLEKFCDAYDIVDADSIIGTDEEAQQMEQQMQQAMAAQQQQGQPGQPGQGGPPGQTPQNGAAPPRTGGIADLLGAK